MAFGLNSDMELIIFDCDGVLVDSEVLASQVLAEALTAEGYPITPAESRARFTGRSMASVVAEIDAILDQPLPDDFLVNLRQKDVVAFERHLKPLAGAEAVIAALPYRKCVASSGGLIKIRHSLTLTGLIDLFDPHLFSAEQVKLGKPAPDLFLFAAEQMRTKVENICVIEDSPAGVTAARAAGMRVIGCLSGGHIDPGWGDALRDAGALSCFTDYRELPGLLAGLE